MEEKWDKNENQDSVSALLSQRTDILQTKLGIISVQLLERLKLRSKNIDTILNEEEALGTLILNREYHDPMNPSLDSLRQQQRFLGQERRSQNVDCWRDLTHVIRELLTTWEDLQQSKTRDSILNRPSSEHADISKPHQRVEDDLSLDTNYYD